MDSLMRREPFRGLSAPVRLMDRLMESAFVRPSLLGLSEADMALDVYETNDDVVVKATLPGVKPEDIEVSVEGNTLTIRGETKAEQDVEERNYVYRERRHGRFVRSVALPEVDSDKAEAEFENGVLTLALPKSERTKVKSITVKTK